MIKTILYLAIVTISSFAQAQMTVLPPPPKPPTKKQIRLEDRNHNCIYKNRYNAAQRLQFYPFNKAIQVILVSYDVKPDTTKDIDVKIANSLPMKGGEVDYDDLDEIKTLSDIQVDSLTDLLYNFGFRGPVYSMSISNCFIPRNAILFMDANRKIFEFIEICFQCRRIESPSEMVKIGEMCDQKIQLLKEYFTKQGLQIGTLKWRGMNEN